MKLINLHRFEKQNLLTLQTVGTDVLDIRSIYVSLVKPNVYLPLC